MHDESLSPFEVPSARFLARSCRGIISKAILVPHPDREPSGPQRLIPRPAWGHLLLRFSLGCSAHYYYHPIWSITFWNDYHFWATLSQGN